LPHGKCLRFARTGQHGDVCDGVAEQGLSCGSQIFCLLELQTKAAKPRILELKREVEHGRFKAEPHDFTLDAQIDNYLIHVDSW
jgi:hypothetical protein